MRYTDEMLMAFVDGELDAALRAEIEQALGHDKALAERVARQRRLRKLLADTYDPVLDEPIPARLQQALAPDAGRAPVRAAALGPRLLDGLRMLLTPQAMAMAACVMFGVAIGVGLRSPSGLFDQVDGRLMARGALAQALDERLGSEPASGNAVRLGVSFASRQGSYCRSFALPGRGGLAGLACRADGGWQVDLLANAPASSGSAAYRTAATELPPELLRAVDERIEGSALDAEGERQARQRGWRR
jgi:hypothetical protein